MFGASWGSDDTIVFTRNQGQGLWRVSAAGGTPENFARPELKAGELKYLLPQMLPGGQTVLFTVSHTPLPTWDDTEVVAQSLATGKRTVLIRGGADGRYLRSGHLVYVRRGTLMAVPFSLERLEVTGGAVALIADVMQAGNMSSETADSGAGQFAVSETGSLLYMPGGLFPDPERSLVWVDRTGDVKPLPLPARAWLSPRISPDGGRVVSWTQGDRNVWLHDLTRGTLTRLTSEARNARAIWTADGTRVTYGSAVGGNENIFWKPVDGSGPAERLTTSDHLQFAAAWAPGGRELVIAQYRSRDTSTTSGFSHSPVSAGPARSSRRVSTRHTPTSRRMVTGWRTRLTNRVATRCTCSPIPVRGRGSRCPRAAARDRRGPGTERSSSTSRRDDSGDRRHLRK